MTVTSMQRVQHIPAGRGQTVVMAGGTYTVKATKESTNGVLALVEATVPPACGPRPHVHTVESEAYYVLSGELEVLDGERTFTAKAGDFVFIPSGTLHRFRNTSVQTAKMLFMFTPAGFEELFLTAGLPTQEGEPLPQWTSENDRRVGELAPRYNWADHV
ncbi:cupin domain-containing protein [Streptomyces sp. NPDC090442]|uniref:cupin domain-containing protein n=1 Tax=Streptomyces sp. NPDC090442 TaxID=3365962 RepID=UPI003821F9E5